MEQADLPGDTEEPDLTFEEALQRFDRELPYEAMANITCMDAASSGPDLLANSPTRFSTGPTRDWVVTLIYQNFASTVRFPDLRQAVDETFERLRAYHVHDATEKPPKLQSPSSSKLREIGRRRQKDAS